MQKFLPVWFQLKKCEFNSEHSTISSLAPKTLTKEKDIEKIKPYLDKLKDTLNAKGINNIALTGGYGSGKSTLLKTFQYRHKEDYNFLNISLAAFNKGKGKEDFKELFDLKIKNGKSEKEAEKEIANEFKETLISNDELERQLEISILQQIIYKVKPGNLPESRFKRIINIPKWKLLFLIPFCFILWLSSVILLFKYNYIDKINPSTWILENQVDWNSIFIFSLASLGVGYISKIVVELFSNSKINKVNLKGEIEIGDNLNKSILNEHYDEILYFFEKNDFNVVVIEDLDRFDNTNIFTKLRELNILLNNADSIITKPSNKEIGIKFLYAVGDDLFNDKKERVKFFEYIIPVIPFINSSNAIEQLKTLIKESGLGENIFPKEFLLDITTFIDDIDMRLLINIFHEFVIYRNILKPDVVNGREADLFAMITYKNIDPEDFNKLNNKDGKIFKLINEKKIYIEKFIEEIDKKITTKELEIQNIKKENLSNIRELRRVYLNQILTKFPPSRGVIIADINVSDLLNDKEFLQLIESNNLAYNYRHQNFATIQSDTLSFKFSEIEKEINPNSNYKTRVGLIESKNNNRVDLLQREIEKLKFNKSEIENWDLKQIFKEIDINQYLNDFSNNGLLRNLILEGYINENYNDYISLFHEVSITKEEKKFERNVKSGINEGFDYKLTNIENLIDNHIELKYFGRETILNFDLVDYLGTNYSKYSQKYDAIITVLSNEKERSIEFIDKYISDEKRPLRIFIEKLVKNWRGFWDYIYSKSNYTKEKEDYYLSLIIRFANIDDIISNQNNNTLAIAIEQKPNFLSIVKNTNELNYFSKITKLIEKLHITFEKLDDPNKETKELFDFVYKNNHYQINKVNLQQMIRLNGNTEAINSFETSNYTAILQSNCKPLIEYIDSEINTYIEDVYIMLEQNKSDNEDILIKLLNNEDLEENLKIDIIEKVETMISDLSRIDYIDIKKHLIIYEKVEPTWSNVIDYYTDCESKIDEDLSDFLSSENVYTELSKQKLSKEQRTFEENLLLCNDISDEAYQELLSSCYFGYNSLNFENLDEDKVIGLIDKVLNTTKENYDLLRENFANNHITLIENEFDEFIKNTDAFATDNDDILMILKSEKISIDDRFNYIQTLTEQTIIDSKDISKKVAEIIVHKASKINFEYTTLTSLIKHSNLIENKVKLINLYFDSFTNDEATSLIKMVDTSYVKLFERQRKPTFEDTHYNRTLFGKLKLKGLIKNFDTYSKDAAQIRVIANY